MPSEKHQKQARKALSVRTLTPTQMEDCIPSVAAALESAYAEGERDAAQRAAEMADKRSYHGLAREIRAEFGIGIEEKANG